ncbi:MAG: hypothetical protein GWP91_01110 [Rhodobacterales bacterium]|nr:hypothetical protein [Rhodobacterales bacterium]
MMWLLLLTGCTQNVFFPPDLWMSDSGDSGAFCRNQQVGEMTCDADNANWTWTARSEGWVERGTLSIFRLVDGAAEVHGMTRVATDPGGGWDQFETGPLQAGVSVDVQENGVSSQFACSLDHARLTAVVRFYDAADDLVDCLVWGDDTESALAQIRNIDPQVSAMGGCRILNE